MTKMDKADKFTSELLEKVMKQQAKQREKADELERQRIKLEEEKAKRESDRDEQFMTLLGQLVATTAPANGITGSSTTTITTNAKATTTARPLQNHV